MNDRGGMLEAMSMDGCKAHTPFDRICGNGTGIGAAPRDEVFTLCDLDLSSYSPRVLATAFGLQKGVRTH
jgi:hypothetical protein